LVRSVEDRIRTNSTGYRLEQYFVPNDVYLGLDYQLFDRMAIGVGLNSVRMNLGVDKENANGNLDWNYDGGLIFLKFDF